MDNNQGPMRADNQSSEFYSDAVNYWNKIPPTVDGMLGGFGFISNTDIDGSRQFLKSLFKIKDAPGKSYALDCGSGIGRITKNLLVKCFKFVDLVEQNNMFVEAGKDFLQSCSSQIGEFFNSGLQNFCPEKEKYDVIWCQWVLAHLSDDDLIEFFRNCINGLKHNGVIIVKENVTNSNELITDTKDSSVTRPYDSFKKIFKLSGLNCIRERKQLHFPQGVFPVYMFALRSI